MTQICKVCGKAKTTDSSVPCIDCWAELCGYPKFPDGDRKRPEKKRPMRIVLDVKKAFGVQSIAAKLLHERKKNSTKPVDITVSTTAPSKWRFVDLETGEVYLWNDRRKRFTKDYAAEVVR